MNAAGRAVPALTRSFANAAKNQKYYILMCKFCGKLGNF